MTDRLLSRCYHSTDYVPLTRETVRTPVIRSSAHTIMTAKEAMIKIVKQYRVLYRSADGCATYMAVISEGSELLRISPDGPPQYNVIEGVSLADAFWGGVDRPVAQIGDTPFIDVEPLRLVEPEPLPEPEPEPVPDPITDLEAAIITALGVGRVPGHDALLQRMANNGVRADMAAYYSAFGQLLAAARIQYEPGGGIWLSSTESGAA